MTEALLLTVLFFAFSILYVNLNPFAWKEFLKEDAKYFIIVQAVRLAMGILISFIGYWFFFIAVNPMLILVYHGVSIAITQLISGIYAICNYSKGQNFECAKMLICGIILLACIFIPFVQSPFICEDTHNFVNETASQTDSLIMVSTDDMNLITKKTANRDVKLSLSNFADTSRYKSGNLYKQEVNGNKVWVSPIDYADFFRALGDPGIPGYVTVDVSKNKEVTVKSDMKMVYSPNANFDKTLNRHVHIQYPDVLLFTPSFELDDNGNAFWIVPYGHFRYFMYFEVVDGVITVNPTTGETVKYTMDNIPSWINTVIPADIAELYCEAYGENKLGLFAKMFSPSSQFTLTVWKWADGGDDAWSIIFDESGQMWYVSDTTRYKGNERTMLGYLMLSARTGEIRYNSEIKGINGNGICQNFKQPYKEKTGWLLAEPTLYLIDNIPTWFSTIVDENGEIQMYCFGTLEGNIATNANFVKALSEYRALINSYSTQSTENNFIKISGDIFRVNVIEDNTYVIISNDKSLVISIPNYVSDLAKMSKEGDFIEIEYSVFENERAHQEAVANSVKLTMK